MATSRNSTTRTLSFHQVRGLLASAAHQTFTQDELTARLQAVGVTELPQTRWGLAMRYAWVLLPGKKGK